MAFSLPQMFTHSLTAKKGWIPGNMGALDTAAQLSPNVTIANVYAGRVAHKNSVGQLEMGHTGTQMPLFLWQNSYDNDVAQISDDGSVCVVPAGEITCLVATGSYELESTEFDNTQTYNYNDPLHATASNTNATTGGQITNAGITIGGTTPSAICGIVSVLPAVNENNQLAISFWSLFIPGAAGH